MERIAAIDGIDGTLTVPSRRNAIWSAVLARASVAPRHFVHWGYVRFGDVGRGRIALKHLDSPEAADMHDG
jgi:hypothetical protein